VSQTQIALLALVVTIFGWYATYFYTKRREDRTRRLEAKLKHMERQIDELYGPLHALIQQIFAVWQVREDLLKVSALTEAQKEAARDVIWREFFRPIHEQIQVLLRTKLHLVQGKVPYSFEEYLQHAVNEATQHALFDKLQIDIPGTTQRKGWPKEFAKDVFLSLRHIREDYDESLRRFDARRVLGSGSWIGRRRRRRAVSQDVEKHMTMG